MHSLRTHLHTLGLTALADKVERCCTRFRVLVCDQGHVAQRIPAERCRLRLCQHCARWRQQRAMTRLWPAIRALRRRHPEDRWVFMTFTAEASDEPLDTCVHRFKAWFAKFRRLSVWKTAIRGAVAGYEATYHHGRGWHVHVHLLASRRAWVDQAALARAWHHVSAGHGTIVDIRDRDADIRVGMTHTLTYPFKAINLGTWGPPQVAEFLALGRTKLAECYGALRGLTSGLGDDAEASDDPPGGQVLKRMLATGAPCPSCGAPLTAQWYTAAEVRWARELARHRPQAPPDRPRAA